MGMNKVTDVKGIIDVINVVIVERMACVLAEQPDLPSPGLPAPLFSPLLYSPACACFRTVTCC